MLTCVSNSLRLPPHHISPYQFQAAEAGLWEGFSPAALPAASPLEQDLAAIEELRAAPAGVRSCRACAQGLSSCTC